jgi:hypothetical protein
VHEKQKAKEALYIKRYNNTTKIEELNDQLISVLEPGNLTSCLPSNAATNARIKLHLK